jgi:hypothetical protein
MMLLEITAGIISHSMALPADGWHMSTDAIAFVMTALAYHFTRRHAGDARFSFGTGKIGAWEDSRALSYYQLSRLPWQASPCIDFFLRSRFIRRSDRNRGAWALRKFDLRFPPGG